MPEIKFQVGKALLAELDELAEDLEVTRGETIRTFLRLGLDTFWDSQDEEEEEEEEEEEPSPG